MPTYIYKYTDTGETVEIQQGINEPALKEILGRPVVRIIGKTDFLLRGKGFYKTDYAKEKGK